MESFQFVNPARTVVNKILKLKKGETFLITKDDMSPPRIAEALATAAKEVDADPVIATYSAPLFESTAFTQRLKTNPYLVFSTWNPQGRYYPHINQEPRVATREPPKLVIDALKSADAAFVYAESYPPIGAIKEALKNGTRILRAPAGALTEERFIRMLRIDYDEMIDLAKGLKRALSGKHTVRVTTPAGTDMTFEHHPDRPFDYKMFTGPCDTRGSYVNFALGISSCAPKEGTASGKIVVDGAVFKNDIPLWEPLEIEVKNHKVANASGGGRLSGVLLRELEATNDPKAYTCPAEWGIGINPGANMDQAVEGECCFGTAHFAIGKNEHVGGLVKSKFHADVTVWDPTIEVDGKVVLSSGKFYV